MCATVLPKEVDMEKAGRGGMALIHYTFNYDHWEFRQETGADKGRDCIFEYVEQNNEWHNGTIRCQVKGTKKPERYLLTAGTYFSYALEKRTINYALRSRDAFLLFLCDLKNEKVYFLPIQEYFIANPNEYMRLANKSETMSLRIPVTNIITKDEDAAVVDLSRNSYAFVDGQVVRTITTG